MSDRRRARPTSRPRASSGVVSARERAVQAVERTLSSRSPLEPFLAAAVRGCGRQDRGLVRELVLGGLRWLRRLDHVLASAADRRVSSIDAEILTPMRIAAYQLLFLDRIPAHAAVDEAVSLVLRRSHRGSAGFANAVLRKISTRRRLADWPVRISDEVRRLAVEESHPDFLVERWWRRFGGPATRQLLAANNRQAGLHLLAFRDRGGRDELARRLESEGCTTVPSELAPLGLRVLSGDPLRTRAFADGSFYVQDEGSQTAALLPLPEPGERILDAASAPGGKSFALLSYEPTVGVALADVSVARLGRLRSNLERLGRRPPVLVADGARPATRGSFDRVVLDLPCTGTGTLRRHPELKWRVSSREIVRLQQQGRQLLEGGGDQVRTGGRLVVVTCSLEPEENEDLISGFLASRSGWRRVDDLAAPGTGDRWMRGPGLWRLLTTSESDGFTVQVLKKVS